MNYLEKFIATCKQSVDLELADRYDFAMRKEGDKAIKQQMATARRAATSMTKLLQEFNLPDAQALPLKQAAATLRDLAHSLEGLAAFAKRYHAWCKVTLQREHEERLDKLAAERWGGDTAAMEFEWALIEELQTRDGRRALGQWMHSQGCFTDIPAEKFHGPFLACTLLGINKTREAANCLDAVSWKVHQYTEARLHCHVGTLDYEKYLAARKAAAEQAKSLVQKLSHQATP